jgi:prepilin-type N-terminal cleavage/methylation domain-containing protein
LRRLAVKERLKKRLREERGFTLVELLVSTIVLLLATSIVATGIPVARNAIMRLVDTANARTLLSTTTTVLREQLGFANSITPSADSKSVTFIDGRTGGKSKIYLTEENGYTDIYIQEFSDAKEEIRPAPRILVTTPRTGAKMHIAFESVATDANRKVATIKKLRVIKEGETEELVKLDALSVRSIQPQKDHP